MFIKEIEYVDFNGIERKERFYFHLSTPEVVRIQAGLGGITMEDYVELLVERQDIEKMIAFIEKMVLTSYGVKSDDGKSFIKNEQITQEFEYSTAYAELFEELLTDPQFAQEFGTRIAEESKVKSQPKDPNGAVKEQLSSLGNTVRKDSM